MVGIIGGVISSSIGEKVFLDPEYNISLAIMMGFGYLMNAFNAALFYRYLAEQRIFMILVRSGI